MPGPGGAGRRCGSRTWSRRARRCARRPGSLTAAGSIRGRCWRARRGIYGGQRPPVGQLARRGAARAGTGGACGLSAAVPEHDELTIRDPAQRGGPVTGRAGRAWPGRRADPGRLPPGTTRARRAAPVPPAAARPAHSMIARPGRASWWASPGAAAPMRPPARLSGPITATVREGRIRAMLGSPAR